MFLLSFSTLNESYSQLSLPDLSFSGFSNSTQSIQSSQSTSQIVTQQQVQLPVLKNYTISVSAMNQNSLPIPMKIQYVTSSKVITASSSNGSFNIAVPNGNYTEKMTEEFYNSTTAPKFFQLQKTVAIGSASSANVNPSIYQVSGRLTFANGMAIPKAVIDTGVCPVTVGSMTGTQQDVRTTDNNGNYVLNVMPGTCNGIKVTLPSGIVVYPSTRTLSIASNGIQNIQLPSPINVNGVITDQNGSPILATVQFVGSDTESTTTDSTGKYSFNIPTGSYVIKFSQEFFNGTNTPRFFDAEKKISVNSTGTFSYQPVIDTISGQTNMTSTLIDVRSILSNNGYTGYSEDQVTTDPSGHFTAKILDTTDNHIQVHADSANNVYACTLNSLIVNC